MKTTESISPILQQAKPVLHDLVDGLIKTILPVAVRNNTFIVNDVPAGLFIDVDANDLAGVISGLLRSVIHNAKESCIRISANEMYGNTIVLSIKDSNSFNTYGVVCSLQNVVPLAQKIGGKPVISSQRQKITTIAFRFPIQQQEERQFNSFG